jgi:hypothetical protein
MDFSNSRDAITLAIVHDNDFLLLTSINIKEFNTCRQKKGSSVLTYSVPRCPSCPYSACRRDMITRWNYKKIFQVNQWLSHFKVLGLFWCNEAANHRDRLSRKCSKKYPKSNHISLLQPCSGLWKVWFSNVVLFKYILFLLLNLRVYLLRPR